MANVEPGSLTNFNPRPYGDANFNKPGSVDHMNTPYDVLSVRAEKKSYRYDILSFFPIGYF